MKSFILLNLLFVFFLSSFQVGLGNKPAPLQSAKDTTLAMLMNQPYQKEISALIQMSLQNRNKIVLMKDQKSYPITDENLANLLFNKPKATLRIIQHPDTIRKMLPMRTNILAILLVSEK